MTAKPELPCKLLVIPDGDGCEQMTMTRSGFSNYFALFKFLPLVMQFLCKLSTIRTVQFILVFHLFHKHRPKHVPVMKMLTTCSLQPPTPYGKISIQFVVCPITGH